MTSPRKLTAEDIPGLKALLRFTSEAACRARESTIGSCGPEYSQALKALEEALTPAAKGAYLHWTSYRLRAEVARWVPGYKLKRSLYGGWSAYRWIRARNHYATKPEATGLDDTRVAAFSGYIRLRGSNIAPAQAPIR